MSRIAANAARLSGSLKHRYRDHGRRDVPQPPSWTELVSFDIAAIGTPGEELAYEVTEAAMLAYAEATDDVPGGPVFAIVPVWRTIAPASRAVAPGDVRRFIVHYEQDMVLHRPIAPGATLLSRATPVALLARPNGTSLVIKTETRDGDGELVNEQYVTEFFRGVTAEEGVGERAPDHRLEVDGEPPLAEVTYAVADDQTVQVRRCLRRRLRDSPRRRVRTTGRAPGPNRARALHDGVRGTRGSGGRGRRRPARGEADRGPLLGTAVPGRIGDDEGLANRRCPRLRVAERGRHARSQGRPRRAPLSWRPHAPRVKPGRCQMARQWLGSGLARSLRTGGRLAHTFSGRDVAAGPS